MHRIRPRPLWGQGWRVGDRIFEKLFSIEQFFLERMLFWHFLSNTGTGETK
jgi:hypothetical protein